MQFSILTVLALATAAMAGALPMVKRQEIDVSTPAMTDEDGNVVPYDVNGVVQSNKDAGL